MERLYLGDEKLESKCSMPLTERRCDSRGASHLVALSARSMINSCSISPLRELHGESRAARDIVQPIIEAVSSWHPIVRSSGSVRT